MQNDISVLKNLNKQRSSRFFTYNLHRVSMTVLLFTAACDWETVSNVILANSSSKPDQLGYGRKCAEQSSNA